MQLKYKNIHEDEKYQLQDGGCLWVEKDFFLSYILACICLMA